MYSNRLVWKRNHCVSGGIGGFKGEGPRIISIWGFLECHVICVQQRFCVFSCLVVLYRDPEIENVL